MCVPPSLLAMLLFVVQAARGFQTASHHGLFSAAVALRTRRWAGTGRAQVRSGFVAAAASTTTDDGSIVGGVKEQSEDFRTSNVQHQFMIHWKGERENGYSKPFRHDEFSSALHAILASTQQQQQQQKKEQPMIEFEDALDFQGDEAVFNNTVENHNEAMQYIVLPTQQVTKETLIATVQRCSLVHALYEIVADGDAETTTYETLGQNAIQNGGMEDLYKGNTHQHHTWCFRVRSYGNSTDETPVRGKDKRSGHRARSLKKEKEALVAMTDLFIQFGGGVDLRNPDCMVYVFDGLKDSRRILTRRLADGPKTSVINPNTRICVTNTPLTPIAAYCLCNFAQICHGSKVLDPYAGSCTSLLAAAMIASTSQTVGIEIAHDGLVNREHILEDFAARNLAAPKALIEGDSTYAHVRREARGATHDGGPFDCIVADPPYGIRESMGHNDESPMEELFASITNDRENGERLLAVGGRLVAFVPVTDDETLWEMLPDDEATSDAGLELELYREQVLNRKLSRWLVSYVCKR
mmetsp:Transcript_13631/g.37514  ORF Transcript_13631/g.37514 Transcript_13631/m.37514 type:complete len:525 (-) Transcript_13631:242-1816(-)